MINTIDSFQGQEKDLILISTVRSNDRKQIGFLMDERRINVSITRAKYAMVIIGNGDTLGSNEIWDGYLKFIEANKLYFELNTPED
jgi:superfamily I DNA and/or RNA helicase